MGQDIEFNNSQLVQYIVCILRSLEVTWGVIWRWQYSQLEILKIITILSVRVTWAMIWGLAVY
jgi:hypothetical protein